MNRYVIGFAFLTFVFAGLFLADLTGYFNVAANPIAILKAKDGTIRRLGNKQLTWDRANGGTLFGNGDTIATGEQALALLTFYAGAEIELDPNSMLVIQGTRDEIKLNFVSGTGKVRISKKSAAKIKIRKGRVTDTTSASASTGKNNLSGALNGQKKSDLETALNEDSSSDGIEIEKVDKVIVAPQLTKADIEAGKIVTRSPASATRSEDIQKLKEKKENDLDQKLTKTITEKKIKNKKNTLKTDGEVIAELKLPPTPTALSPAPDAQLTDPKVQLKWMIEKEKKRKRIQYEVTLRPRDGKGESRVIKTKKSRIVFPKVPEGNYVWSVRSIDREGNRSPSSSPRALSLQLSEEDKKALKKEKLEASEKIDKRIRRPRILPVTVE